MVGYVDWAPDQQMLYWLDVWDEYGMVGNMCSGDLASRSFDEPNTLAPSKVKVRISCR